jgi:predicted O-methyltransferase YrrM
MNPAVATVLAMYELRAAREQKLMHSAPAEFMAHIDDYLICVGPEVGQLLRSLAVGQKAQVILELGCAYGYSTLWLADAARVTGGRVVSLELSEKKIAYAQEQLTSAGLLEYVEFHAGDARAILPALAGPFDLVLLDLWKNLYSPCLELFHPKLAPGALIVADNMTFPVTARADASAYQRLLRTKPDLESVLLPIGNGIEVSRRRDPTPLG